jgi:hypothetical protein
MNSDEEKLDIILIYGECRRNAVRVQQLYSDRYPDQNIPSARTVDNICQELLAKGRWNATNCHHSKSDA